MVLIFLIGFGIFSKKTYNVLKLYLHYRDISKDIHRIGEALLNSLIKLGSIKTSRSRLAVNTHTDKYGAVRCHLEGGSILESSTFIENLQEIVEPVENPRYLMVRKSKLKKIINQKDYHAVPEILGKNKTMAEYFRKQWEHHVGRCELIYTRTINGRKKLLEVRIKALSARLSDTQVSEQMSRWI